MLTNTFIPRFSEENRNRHIRSDIITIWMQEAAMEILQMFTPDLPKEEERHLIMVNITVDYVHEILLGNAVEVKTSVNKIGNSSFILQQNIYQEKRLCVKGFSTFVNLDYATHKSRSIPEAIRLRLEEHLIKNVI